MVRFEPKKMSFSYLYNSFNRAMDSFKTSQK